MGWSCALDASRKLNELLAKHDDRGTFTFEGQKYFMEPSRKEHGDGSVTGRVNRIIEWDDEAGSGWSVSVGYFHIAPNGKLTRTPRALRALETMP